MKIKEFSIHRYGPLSDSGRIRLSDFNLFWGENEDGKTLTIEALIKMLLGRKRKVFEGIERVAENPDGYLILQDDTGKELKLPEAGDLTKMVQLSAEECHNLFIIRNSNLSIAAENEFFGNITERLTGLRTSQIEQIKKQLILSGGLTHTGKVADTRESGHLKRRLQLAQQLIPRCQELLQQAEAQGYDTLEERWVSLKRQQELRKQEIDTLEKARLREKFETGQRHIDTFLNEMSALEKLKHFKEEDLQRWRDASRISEEKKLEMQQVYRQLEAQEKARQVEEEKLEELNTRLRVLQRRKTRLDEDVKPRLREYQEFSEEIASRQASRKFFFGITVLSIVLLILSVIGLFTQHSFWLTILTPILFTSTIILLITYWLRFTNPSNKHSRIEQEILNIAQTLGFAGDKMSEIFQQVQQFEDEFQHHQEQVNSSNNRITIFNGTMKSLREDRLYQIERQLREARQTIQSLQDHYQVSSIEIFRDQLSRKRQCEQKIQEASTGLQSLFGSEGKTTRQTLNYWKAQLEELRSYREQAKGVIFNEKELEKKKRELDLIQEQLNTTQGQLQTFREQLKVIERKTNEILTPTIIPEHLPCDSLTDLQVILENLQNFLKDVETRHRAIRLALDILTEIENEEVQKISELFGEHSPVSNYFRDITHELYQTVEFDTQDGIRVTQRDGTQLLAKQLSGGAYDQLYLAIRLALGEKLLSNEKGFFILDDPFIKADPQRLARQMELLLQIADEGWQILYFSAKEEIKEALKGPIGKRKVSLQQVPKTFFKLEREH